jgi:hypothetical protein
LLPGTHGAILARMPIRVRSVGSAFGVLLLAALMPWTAVAELEDVDEADRWVPALSLSAGFLLQDAEASIESGPVLGLSFPDPNPNQPIRPADSGDDLMFTPDVGITLELMTPRVAAEWWAPRFFARAGVSGAFGPQRDIAKEGVIEELEVSPNIFAPDDDAVIGQGSRTRAEVDPLLVRAGAGVAFTVDALGRRFRVRTSIEYLREEIEVQGAVRRAVCKVPDLPNFPMRCGARTINSPGGGGIEDFRAIDLRKTETKDFHGIGPGLELETDVGRIGPIVPSIFIGGQAYRFLGSRKISFSESDPDTGETMNASFEKDPWAYRVGVGVSLRWIPE